MAAPGYEFTNLQGGSQGNVTTTPGITVGRLVTGTANTKRFYVWELEGGQSGTISGTNCQVVWWLCQCSGSTPGTSTAVTANPTSGFVAGANLDTPVTASDINYTTEPTAYTAAQNLWARPINQMASFLWQAAERGEIWLPSTASTGPGMRAYSPTYNSTVVLTMRFSEI